MKKLLCFILALMVMGSLFAVNVSAAEILPTMDFTLEEGDPELDGWTGQVANSNCAVEIVPDPLDPENDVMSLKHDPAVTSGAGAIASCSFTAPAAGELVWMFDIMFNKASSRCYILVGLNGMRIVSDRMFYAENFGNPAVWYNVIVHVEEGGKVANVYKREKGSGNAYSRIVTDCVGSAHNFVGLNVYTVKGPNSSVGDPDIIYIDNSRVLSGMYMEDLKFMLGEKEVNTVADINEAGTLTASYKLMNADLSEESEAFECEHTHMLPAMVVFDKNGKMLDCISYSDDLQFLDNSVELNLDVTEFYDKLEGGSVNLYVWDSLTGLQVLMDEVILSAAE